MQKDPAGLDPDSTWEASSNMKKYDDKYELSLTFIDGKTKAKRESTVTKSVGDFIDENGVICQDILEVIRNVLLKVELSMIFIYSARGDENAQFSDSFQEGQIEEEKMMKTTMVVFWYSTVFYCVSIFVFTK